MSKVLSIAEGPIGRACLLDKNRPARAHAHLGPHAMLQIEGVAHEYDIAGVPAILDRSNAVLVNNHELHGNRSLGSGHSVVLMLYLTPAWIAERFPGLPGYVKLFPKASVQLNPALRDLADELASKMREADDIDDDEVQWLFTKLAVGICDTYGPATPSRQRISKLNDFRIRRAIALMHESLEEPLSASELSSRVGLSRSRFFELFTACTGLSPKHYGNMLRLDLATRCLAGDTDPIAEISQKCGFGAQSHFSKFFVEQQGFTPREFRRAAAPAVQAAPPALIV